MFEYFLIKGIVNNIVLAIVAMGLVVWGIKSVFNFLTSRFNRTTVDSIALMVARVGFAWKTVSNNRTIKKIENIASKAFFSGGIAMMVAGVGCFAWKWEHPEAEKGILAIGLITFVFGMIFTSNGRSKRK